LFYEIANKHRLDNPNSVAAHYLWGGVARVDDEYIAAYRFADGGRDWHGRTGRFVLMAAFVNAGEAAGKDLTPLLLLPEFERIVRVAPAERPVSPPVNLKLEIEPQQNDFLASQTFQRLKPEEIAALEDAGRRMKQMTANRRWRCTIRIGDQTPDVRFEELPPEASRMVPQPAPSAPPEIRTQRSPETLDAPATGHWKNRTRTLEKRIRRILRDRMFVAGMLAGVLIFLAGMLTGLLFAKSTYKLDRRPLQIQTHPGQAGSRVNEVPSDRSMESLNAP
jgi:hypothetical protein